MCKIGLICQQKLKMLFAPLDKFEEHVAKTEARYLAMKEDIASLKASIDPLSELLMQMEDEFQKTKRKRHVHYK